MEIHNIPTIPIEIMNNLFRMLLKCNKLCTTNQKHERNSIE